jgi:hypothetical protein
LWVCTFFVCWFQISVLQFFPCHLHHASHCRRRNLAAAWRHR